MSIDETIRIAGQPILSPVQGLESIEFEVIDSEHVRLQPRVRPGGDAVWRQAIEHHTGQPFTADGPAEARSLQSDAFLLVFKDVVATLTPPASCP